MRRLLSINRPKTAENTTLKEIVESTILISNSECFSYCGLSARTISQLCEIRAEAETPEHINNNPNTAPSKRILPLYPGYNKVLDGFNIAQDIGIDTMRKECKYFDLWLQKIEALA